MSGKLCCQGIFRSKHPHLHKMANMSQSIYEETYDSPQTWIFWMTLVVSSHFFPEASRIPCTFSISWCKILGSKELTQLKIHWNPAIPSTSCGKFIRTTLSGASWWRWTGTHVPTSSRAVASRSVSSSWNVARSREGLQTTSKIQQNSRKTGFWVTLLTLVSGLSSWWLGAILKRDFIQLGRRVKSLEFEHQTQQFLGMLLLI